MMGMGSKIDRLLKERNMTVMELARRVDVSPTTLYSMIQRDNKKVDIDVLFGIAKALGVDAEYFSDTIPEQPHTLAAHFDGNEFTEEEMDEIQKYAEFVKSRRKG